ncbi:MAG: dihydroorotate dehydrogenase [Candidatus Aminicenantes bacterium]|jgi:dihydroorotate dehydrogenase (NAD+) catalytic subunit|nr:dihydroorotate dehydrogenase [Candidatus Aminicenantes bacterium]
MADLTVDLGFRTLKNPVITASGTFGYGEEFLPFFDLDILGAIIMKGIFREPRPGNPPPRLVETPAGVLNSIGLAGPGSEKLQEIIRRLHTRTNTPIIVNVCGEDDREFAEVAAVFSAMDEVAMLELNISCPNIKKGGACPAQDADHTARLVRQVKKVVGKPLIVKLSPNTADIVEVAQAAQDAGADALSLVNTFLGLAVDLEKRKPVFANVYAGLSGPAVKPLALRLVREVCRRSYVPVIGMGGISSGRDVLDYILVGAAAVQIGTVNFYEPGAAVRIIGEIETEMDKLQIKNLSEIRGKLQT